MASPLSPSQLGLLRLASGEGASPLSEGDANDLAVLIRTGLVRDLGDGLCVATDAGRRYAKAQFGEPPAPSGPGAV